MDEVDSSKGCEIVVGTFECPLEEVEVDITSFLVNIIKLDNAM